MRRSYFLVTVLFMFTACLVYAADQGKIAVGVQEKGANAEVSDVAARSPYFALFDWDGRLLEVVENPHASAQSGAGLTVVPFLAEKGVKLVVAERFGEKMIQFMKSRGIEYLELKGKADAAVRKVLEAKKSQPK